MDPNTLDRYTRPHGSLCRDDLVPSVMSLSGWYRLHVSGALVALHPGVSRRAEVPETTLMQMEAALAATIPGAALAGLSAA